VLSEVVEKSQDSMMWIAEYTFAVRAGVALRLKVATRCFYDWVGESRCSGNVELLVDTVHFQSTAAAEACSTAG
jgi:hypothetical protein